MAGFSLKTQKVYKAKDPKDIKRVTAVEVNKFIAEHANKNQAFKTEHIKIRILKPGQQFNFGEE